MSERPTLAIERLNLRLPTGYGRRANAIARETVRQLATMPLSNSLDRAALHVPAVRVAGGETDRVIAQRIARTIHGQLCGAQVSGLAKGK